MTIVYSCVADGEGIVARVSSQPVLEEVINELIGGGGIDLHIDHKKSLSSFGKTRGYVRR